MTSPSAVHTRERAFTTEALALGLPVAVFLVLNRRALDFFFLRDDTCLLASALENGVAAHLTDPIVWRSLSSSLLMPWQIVSLGMDLRWFGLEPTGFYAHHLFSFCVLLAMGYAALRRLLPPVLVSFALLLFIATPPSVAVGELLMNRHYVEGLAFALAATWLQHEAVRRDRIGLALGSAAFYALACAAKEVFVPLLLLLPFLPRGELPLRPRLRLLSPHAVLGLAYAGYRVHMLGFSNTFASYGALGSRSSSFSTPSVAAAGIVAIASLFLVLRSRKRWAVLLTIAAALVFPIAFVTTGVETRHAFAPAFVACTIVALALREVGGKPAVVLALALVAGAAGTLRTSSIWTGLPTSETHYRAEGRFVLEHEAEGEGGGEGAVLLTSLNNTLYLACTVRLREATTPPATVAFCGEPCLCRSWFGATPRFRYEGEGEGEGGVGAGAVVADDSEPSACALGEPVEADFQYESEASSVSWELGPYEDGSYHLLLLSGEAPASISVPQTIPARGHAPLFLSKPLRLMVKYRSPEGWLAFSPVRTLAP